MDTMITDFRVSAYTIPTEKPESDGTLQWNSTTLVLVEVLSAGSIGVGYTYSSVATAKLIESTFREVVLNTNPMDIGSTYQAMVHATRNLGRPGLVSMAISAVDVALWDLKSKLLGIPLSALLGQVRSAVPVYGSGGFTSYTDEELHNQTAGWIEQGIARVKIKVGRDAKRDPHRVRVVRAAIGDCELFVDANGGYKRKEAIGLLPVFADLGVTWYEEPVSSDDLDGLRLVRDAACHPSAGAAIEITAGEYGFHSDYFLQMLQAGAVDVMQADATRCGGMTGVLSVAAICEAFHIPLSTHCAPSLHVALGCSIDQIRHIEYFHDHVRIEQKLFDGFVSPVGGEMRPSLQRLGLGLELKTPDAEKYRVNI